LLDERRIDPVPIVKIHDPWLDDHSGSNIFDLALESGHGGPGPLVLDVDRVFPLDDDGDRGKFS
jgi:hypothetical protein